MKIKLKKIVAEFIDSKDGSSQEFRRLYNIAVRGMREFNLDVTGRPKTVILKVGPTKTVELPPDYIRYFKVGVVDVQGQVYTFKQNPELSGLQGNMEPVFSNYLQEGKLYNLMSQPLSGRATIGEFRVDEEAGVIYLGAECSYPEIALEYLPDGYEESDGDYSIDHRAEEAFICYLRWKNATDLRKKFSQGEVRLFKVEYYRERKLAKRRMNPVIISEMEDVRRASVKAVARA